MYFASKTFWIAKDADQPGGFQDGFKVEADLGTAAIADGVSSTLFSGAWSRIVTEHLARLAAEQDQQSFTVDTLSKWLEPCREEWLAGIDESKLAWHQKNKLHDGAASTALWIRLSPDDDTVLGDSDAFQLHGYAVGDCCLFHVRSDQVLRAFPLEQSELFDNVPDVVRSSSNFSVPEVTTLNDLVFPGDLLVLCTDALAAWGLQRLEAGQSPQWDSFWSMSQNDWSKWVLRMRKQEKLRYDDTTLILLRVRHSE